MAVVSGVLGSARFEAAHLNMEGVAGALRLVNDVIAAASATPEQPQPGTIGTAANASETARETQA